MRKMLIVIFLFVGLGSWTLQQHSPQKETPPEKDPAKSIALPDFMRLSPEWALKKLDSMTLEEKIAQSLMVAVTPKKGEEHLEQIDSLITTYNIGGVIFFQGTVQETKEAIQRFQKESKLPLLVGIDAEWGSVMRLSDGKRFPYQITMGASNQLKSIRTIGAAMGKELKEMGVQMSFSPVADVNTNPDNPIIGFRSFGENPVQVAQQTVAMIKGLQQFNVLSCMKHFPGHGSTSVDSHKSLPIIKKSVKQLNRVDWLPYKQGRLAGASAVMVAHLDVPSLDDSGLPASISPKIIQEYLRGKLKFKGLVVSDALNMGALTNKYGDVEIVKKAYLAGNDILLYPSKIKESIMSIKKAVLAGEISRKRVNQKVIRILRAKYYAIIHESSKEQPKLTQEEVEYAKWNIYEKALVVIKDSGNAIPARDVSGRNLVLNIGGKGTAFNRMITLYLNADTTHFKTGKEALKNWKEKWGNYDKIFINIIASSPWPWSDFHYPKGWRELLKNLPNPPKIYVTIFGNPYAVTDHFDFQKADVVVLAFQNSQYGQNRAAQLLLGGFQGTSVLPITLSADYQEGFGIITPPASRLKFTVPFELGVTKADFHRIDSIAIDGIEKGAYPSCQVVAAKNGKVIYRKSFGRFTYDKNAHLVNNRTLYDLASITKIAASTYSLMYLQDKGKFSLDKNLGDYLPKLTEGTPYAGLLMRDIVAHQARLKPWIPFYTKTLVNGYPDMVHYYSTSPQGARTAPVAKNLYIDTNYEDTMFQIIVHTPLRKVKEYKYSDLAFYFGKRIIEKLSGKQEEDFVAHHFYLPMGLTTMGYNPRKRFPLDRIAPTEKDDYFRHQLVHGYVHDMGAAMMNQVGGHAGLFSDATDLAAYMQMLLNKGIYGGKRYLSKAVIEEYTSCQFCPDNRRGAGFDKPVLEGNIGPCSSYASASSFGHSGFTGTLAWADPKTGINYVFVSNRVYPSGENWKIVHMDIRTKIQSVVYEAFQ